MPKPANGDLPLGFRIRYIAKGTFLSLVVSFIVILLLAVVLLLTPLPERAVPYVVYITSIFSIIMGSAYAAKRIESRGWLHGGLTGLAYGAILLLFTRVFGLDLDINLHLFTKILLAFVLGSIGGILGLNL